MPHLHDAWPDGTRTAVLAARAPGYTTDARADLWCRAVHAFAKPYETPPVAAERLTRYLLVMGERYGRAPTLHAVTAAWSRPQATRPPTPNRHG